MVSLREIIEKAFMLGDEASEAEALRMADAAERDRYKLLKRIAELEAEAEKLHRLKKEIDEQSTTVERLALEHLEDFASKTEEWKTLKEKAEAFFASLTPAV